ncbi:DNA-directed rna polymerase I largest subunit, putative [Bodo saltans]|uniref:DNA-directed RNA polymerase n=1 Tax=Bodo saltans TaxID=75058 RepID=A0A0S4JSQ7_BODSA|nr:DNA-directed rna polymerase I largest subunit, putative [Bodo saltans]|eukprot:CUG93267.1 DNA-directed rna polymerase I largest subunit, putative [Bodo saltans]
MSLITNFNFKAFATDLRARETLQNKNGFSLSLLSSGEMERMSVVDVSCRLNDKDLDRGAPWAPKTLKKYPGMQWPTFWDARMGNFDQRTFATQRCATCQTDDVTKQGNERCLGHFGTIRMPRMYPAEPARDKERVVVYNPHLAQELEVLLQAECFACHRFRAPDLDIHRYLWALLILDFGFVGEALHLLDIVATSKGQEAKGKRMRDPNEQLINDHQSLETHAIKVLSRHGIEQSDIADALQNRAGSKLSKTLAAQDVRNQVVKEALSSLKEASNACSHCHSFSPRVTSKDSQFFFHFGKKTYIETNLADGTLSQSDLNDWERDNKRHNRSRTYFNSNLAQAHIQSLCTQEAVILSLLFPHLGESSVELRRSDRLSPDQWHTVFFLDRLLVPPLPLRLSSGVQIQDSGTISPDSKTKLLDNALGFVEQIESYYNIVRTGKHGPPTDAQEIANEINLRNLQLTVNESFTSVMDSFAKKEGLFRMHMMGKRVNQACRSVISPDYLVEPNEVLLPRPFARSLSFPEQIVLYAPARTAFLKQCIINGAKKYPGATHIEHRLQSGEIKIIDLTRADDVSRRQTAERIFAQATQQKDVFIVYRHILDGDRAIFNRQPTLHKPSMMGYRIRVLSGLKTLRFHYVNGKSYNADFDGDEMNIHIPQSIEAKAELECLMDANMNFLVPTSGKPIRGLIQDHVAAGVLMTTRDKFMDRETFTQFLYFAIFPYLGTTSATTTLSEMIPMPTMLKPKPLWTGKQLVSVIVRFVSGVYSGKQLGPTLRGTSLIQPSAYTHTDLKTLEVVSYKKDLMGDDRVVFLNGELLSGAVCKNQLGPSAMSVAHIIHELYGPHAVGDLFGALGRVLTQTLQREGFSMGVDDMALTHEPRRTHLLRQLDECALDLPDDEAVAMGRIMELSTKLQKEFVPGRMLVPFPANQLLMMTVSGAKGSNTNTIQMALGLGQQLFDGQRVKRMNSGKTLPGFFTGEKRARSFGYAMGRFASGIRPPEYTIHAMAGRDGLIDTAVKTSRSGHLQRCLIKGMESLTVSWDRSVRDSNGSIVQFTYGGDGLDPCKASTLTSWDMVKENLEDLQVKYHCILAPHRNGTAQQGGAADAMSPTEKKQNRKRALEADASQDPAVVAENLLRNAVQDESARAQLPQSMKASLNKHMDTKADIRTFTRVSQVTRWTKHGGIKAKMAERKAEFTEYFKEVCEEITAKRRIRAYAEAGEPVGLLAAQAAGEPSTQMTLNTFHSAGSTVTHVTEGIPRLRELLIHASVQKVAVVIPVEKAGPNDEAAVRRILKAAIPVNLKDCLAPIPHHRNVRLAVHRTSTTTEIDVALLFSKSLLANAAASMCMSRGEHVSSFTAALRAFVKSTVNVLRGRAPAGAERKEKKKESPSAFLPLKPPVNPPLKMTLNTFHSAGSTVTHVTEGIPRLRELLIHASVQKVAVVIPVEKAGPNDEAAVRRILKAAVPVNLKDCLAPIPHHRNVRLAVHRTSTTTEIDVALLFSKSLLANAAASMCMSRGEHVASFTAALRAFVKSTVNVLRGRAPVGAERKGGDEEGATAVGVDDPAALLGSKDDGNASEDRDESDVESDAGEKDAADQNGSSPLLRGAKANGDDVSDLDVEDDEEGNKAAAAAGSDSDDDDLASKALRRGGDAAAESTVDYTAFAMVTCTYGGGRFKATIKPVPGASVAALPEEFFVVRVKLVCPPNLVAVIPDVVQQTLETVSFPTWLPQFEKCHFTRSSEDATSGELWFQGRGATVKAACSIVQMFSLDAPAIKLRKARSTDINDMAASCGIESAYRSLLEELIKLFKRYAVDPRHMSLVADTATHRGIWENFNFTGVIARSASPLFQMTFASAKRFLHTAVTRGIGDGLDSISSAIMVGERPKVGTATVKWANERSLLQDVFERTHSSTGVMRTPSSLR